MNKRHKLINILLFSFMLVVFSGALYVAVYAAIPSVQSTQGSIFFDADSGIRYNEITGEFEVFNDKGVSWIASGGYVKVDGTTSTSDAPVGEGWHQTTQDSSYNIMCDITYNSGTSFHSNFASGITLGEHGKINGRDYVLAGFPMKTVTVDGKSYGTALVAKNSGSIRNVTMANNAFASSGTLVANSLAGAIVGINKEYGLIDSCKVSGSISTNMYVRLFGIAGYNEGTILKCTNSANITNSAATTSYAAGITSLAEKSNLVNNTNEGTIEATNATSHAAGIAIITTNVEFVASSNTNNGNITSTTSSCGIIGGGVYLNALRVSNNISIATQNANLIFYEYYGRIMLEPADTGELPAKGIKWNPAEFAFQIYNTAGISYISSNYWISSTGLIESSDGNLTNDYKQATSSSYYIIMNDIYYNENEYGFNADFKSIAPSLSGTLDGGGNTLWMFPLRRAGSVSGISGELYSALFLSSSGQIRDLNMHFEEHNSEIDDVNVGVGGITGVISGMFHRCFVSGFITLEGSVRGLGSMTAGFYSTANVAPAQWDNVSTVDLSAADGEVAMFGRECRSNWLEIFGCRNYGDISSGGNAAGLFVGRSGISMSMRSSWNFGNITGGGVRVGGVLAGTTGGNSAMATCRNYGTVVSLNVDSIDGVGGLVGAVYGSATWTVSNCVNFGDVSANCFNIMVRGENRVGAIAGYFVFPDIVKITNCINYGSVGGLTGDRLLGESVPILGSSDKFDHGMGSFNNVSLE